MPLYPQIVLPPHLERIREKLAENIHELWALTRIEQGWTYGPVSPGPGGRSGNGREDRYLGSSGNQEVFGSLYMGQEVEGVKGSPEADSGISLGSG